MGESYLRRKVFGRLARRRAGQQQTGVKQAPPSVVVGERGDADSASDAASDARRHAKLKGASRAIQFLRRAAGQRPAASPWPPPGINNSDSAGRLTLASSASSAHSHSQESQAPPQFIVPRMNALRLPLVCRIRSLEGELMREVFVHRYEEGRYLIESLKVSLGLQDDKYFGLKMASSSDDQEDLRNAWLTLADSVCKQLRGREPARGRPWPAKGPRLAGPRAVDFYLRIKFYPPNLARVQDQFLRHYLWLQLRRDLRLGKLISSANNLCQLMACVCQWELGDYRPELVPRLSELNILPNQDLIEARAVEVWRARLAGLQRHQAQMQFLRAAVILETYGFDYYQVRDHQRRRQYLLGFNYAGVKTIRNGRIAHHFSWHSMSKISLENRMIIFHIYPGQSSKQRKQVLGFKCLSQEECKSLYMRLLEQKYFFTIELAYFDKSVRRPSCLYSSSSSANQPPVAGAESHEPLAGSPGAPQDVWAESSCELSAEGQPSPGRPPSQERRAGSDCGCRLSPSSAGPARAQAAGRLRRQQATLQYLGRANGSEEADEEDELEEEEAGSAPPARPRSGLEQCWRLASQRLEPWAAHLHTLQPAARLCGTLLMMSLLLRCTESLSSYLLDLVSRGHGDPPTPAPS